MEPLEFVTPEPTSREGIAEESESDDQERIDDDDGAGEATLQEAVTRSGQGAVTRPARFIEEIRAATKDYKIRLSMSEVHYYAAMKEFPEGEFAPGEVVCVCAAGLGGGFENTKELHVMKYKKAMKSPDAKNWEVAVDDKHNCMTGSEA